MSLKTRQDQIIRDFSEISNWEDRYKKIIALGKDLPAISDRLKTDEAKIKGCQSQVWLHAKLNEQGLMEIIGDSDALLVRGLVAILISMYSQSTPAEVLSNPATFLKEMGFETNLSPSRANGLFSMIKQIQRFAMAFQVLLQSKK